MIVVTDWLWVQVKDRSAWRTAIEEGCYDPQVETMHWGGKLQTKTTPRPSRTKTTNGVETDRNEEEADNRSEVSSLVEGELTCNVVAKKNVVDITCSILQLAQSVESKYLKKPLGNNARSLFHSFSFILIGRGRTRMVHGSGRVLPKIGSLRVKWLWVRSTGQTGLVVLWCN